MKEKLKSGTIEQGAFDNAKNIFQSFKHANKPFGDRDEERKRQLSDGSEISIIKFVDLQRQRDEAFSFWVRRPESAPFTEVVFFHLNSKGLQSLDFKTTLTIGRSRIPTNVHFGLRDFQDSGIDLEDVKPFNLTSKELINWITKIVQEDKLSEPPISIKPRIQGFVLKGIDRVI